MHFVTWLLAAIMAPQVANLSARFHADDQAAPPSFCADVQPFEAFTIADDGEEFEDDVDMGCTESDGGGPLDVDALVDAI